MAIQETKRQSDLEKRLQSLRRQVYGRGTESQQSAKTEGPINKFSLSNIPMHKAPVSNQAISETAFLRQDLFKILTFSSVAIGAQLIIFFILKNHILNINFF